MAGKKIKQKIMKEINSSRESEQYVIKRMHMYSSTVVL